VSHTSRWRWQASLVPLLIILAAFASRLAYAFHSHPFIDEFTTILAAEQTLKNGCPCLPSGLFYEHGLFFTYIDALFIGLLGTGEFFARLPSIIFSMLSMAVIIRLARTWFGPAAGLLAAFLFLLSPEGMVWGARARMYALAQLLTVLIVWCVYIGVCGRRHRRLFRWLSLLLLLLAFLSQFEVLMLVPALLLGMLFLFRRRRGKPIWQTPRELLPSLEVAAEGLGLALAIFLGVLVKRMGRPLGMPSLNSEHDGGFLPALWQTIAYQLNPSLPNEESKEFLARIFGVPHHIWLLALFFLAGLGIALTFLFRRARRTEEGVNSPLLYLGIVFWGVVLEMIFFLEPFRLNPRYVVIFLPLLYLLVSGMTVAPFRVTLPKGSQFRRLLSPQALVMGLPVIALLGLHLQGCWTDLKIAYLTQEPAYEEAFRYVAGKWRPGDTLLTMNTAPAALYLGRADYFAQQNKAEQFLLDDGSRKVDRWLGIPWIGNAAELNRVLNKNSRVWFVIDTIRQPVYYNGDWLGLVHAQMDKVWEKDEALVYLSKADRLPIPNTPTVQSEADFGGSIQLKGYTIEPEVRPGQVQLTLFLQARAPIEADYSVFVHLRDAGGRVVAQWDGQPLEGSYPTRQWKSGEEVVIPVNLTLPAGLPVAEYYFYLGFYRLDNMQRLPLAGDQSGEGAFISAPFSLTGEKQ
jgi:4-amino-4-deoxy-L-arabinose transferase-like glycosyltransferase